MAISASFGKGKLRNDRVGIDIARAQMNRRCQDLLSIVVPTQSPYMSISLRSCRIEFLHRSVRDFLRQSVTVSKKLGRLAGPSFNPARTLFACYVYLIKRSKRADETTWSSTEAPTILWSTEALLQLASIGDGYDVSAARLLQELDKAMQVIWSRGQKHWTNEVMKEGRVVGAPQKIVQELGRRDLIGHLIELNLFHPVREAMTKNPPAKQYRPYLDYALRYDSDAPHTRSRPGEFWLHSSGDPEMVSLLLKSGCDVNEHIYVYSGRTVWDLYLAFLVQQDIKGERHRKTTWLLINHGAKPISSCLVHKPHDADVHDPDFKYSMKHILSRAFGVEEAEKMCERIVKNAVNEGWWSWLTTRKPLLNNNGTR
jgi:hypothetical protein